MRPMPSRPGLRTLLRTLGRRVPRTRGTLRVAGLHDEVTIARDRWGIPHVTAATDADAWFGLGFCHGQDRRFQLELLSRAGRGTLADLVGRAGLPIDRLSRTLGLRRLAEAQLPLLDADVRSGMEAYVAGINAATAATPRPHELVLLRGRATTWEPGDVLAFLALQSLALAGNWDVELARLRILLLDGPGALAAVEPEPYASWLPRVMPPGAAVGPALARMADDVERLRELVGASAASNAWAVSGSRAVTGAPLLANDPHLAPALPAPWYLAHLRTRDWQLVGCSFVGGPAFPAGHNGHAAWGITAACSDATDLFWEEIDAAAGTARGPGGPEPIERRVEQIAVRGDDPVTQEIVLTARGPVITPLLDGVEVALSLRATWLEPVPLRGFLDVHRVRDFASLRDAFRSWAGPGLNVVYADAAGHIGWQMVGTLPRRGTGHGTVPTPAWIGGWEEEHLAFDDLPWCLDPEPGWIASANNAPRADDAAHPFLGVDWLDGYRAARLADVLPTRTDWDADAFGELQRDVVAVPWHELRDLVLATPVVDDDGRLALELLAAWDGAVAADSAAASVYELLVSELAATVARGKARRGWRWAVGDGFGDVVPRTSLGARTVGRLVASLRDRDGVEAIAGALSAAVVTLRTGFGADPAAWRWGAVRPLRLRHALGGRAPLDRVFDLGPVPLGGDANTVAQAGVRPLAPLANPAAIANHRTVIDLADPDASRYVVAGGQSGNPLSPHHADLFELWQRGECVAIPCSDAAVSAATVETLRLRPKER